MSDRRGPEASARRPLRGMRAAAIALGAAGALLLLGAMNTARADETSAEETFRAGTAAYARGEYRAAALAFEAAYREQPHPAALYNAGQSWAAAGALPRAADAYARALAGRGLDEAQDADARAQLEVLEASLGRVAVSAPAGALVSIAHVDRATAPLVVHLTPGEHAARADLPDGRSIERTVRVGAGERVALAFDAPAKAKPPPAVPPRAPEPGGDRGAMRALGWGALGGAAIAGGVAIFLGVRALDVNDEFNASQHTDQGLHDTAVALRTWTNVTWAAAGALGVTGVVLLYAAPGRAAPRTTLLVSPGGAALAGSF